MNRPTPFGSSPAALALLGVSILITAAIAFAQLHLRADVFDPHWLSAFYYLFLFVDYPASLVVLCTLILGLLPPIQRVGLWLAGVLGRNPVWTACIACLGLAAGALWVYQSHPLSMDEYAPYLQSRIFAAGKLTGQWPQALVDWLVMPEFQDVFLKVSHESGAVASMYWPGFALLLTPFTAIGAPWLANPVIGALSLLAMHRLAIELTRSQLAAGAAALFALASPAFTINAISFYSMPAHLLLNAVFVLLLLSPSPARSFGAGMVGGLALTLHNPVPHLFFSIPWLLWLLMRPDRWRVCAAIAAGYLPWILVAGFGWHHLLVHLTDSPSGSAAVDSASPLGDAIGGLRGVLFAPNEGMIIARLIGFAKLWLWAVPALLPAAALGFWRHRRDAHFRLLLASAATTWIGYMFVRFDQGHGWGFRYFHAAWFVLPIFAASAFAKSSDDPARVAAADPTSAYMHANAATSLIVLTGFFAWQVHGFISAHLAQLPTTAAGNARVVIVNAGMGYYATDLVQNEPFLRDPTIRMLTKGRKLDEQMVARNFPGLVLLDHSFRGTVWGHPVISGSSPGQEVVVEEHREKK